MNECEKKLEEALAYIEEMRTEILHPEFGEIWMPPNGVAYLAYKERDEALAELEKLKNETT